MLLSTRRYLLSALLVWKSRTEESVGLLLEPSLTASHASIPSPVYSTDTVGQANDWRTLTGGSRPHQPSHHQYEQLSTTIEGTYTSTAAAQLCRVGNTLAMTSNLCRRPFPEVSSTDGVEEIQITPAANCNDAERLGLQSSWRRRSSVRVCTRRIISLL